MALTKEEKKERMRQRNRKAYLKRKAKRLGQPIEEDIPDEEFKATLKKVGNEIDSFIKVWIRLTEKIKSRKKKYEDIKEK